MIHIDNGRIILVLSKENVYLSGMVVCKGSGTIDVGEYDRWNADYYIPFDGVVELSNA